ncbi:hypothetical protein ANANG_G00176610 [Anguilla anguilla]|uniref:Uncharacterized protein n=1 Tax=Anguilla anguilla TaxID=7936 RepID=A0A9D3M4F8_ANGAN|nr:hypothetical protein ANANG_G00176610 [Anguilla anguilla]
MRLQKLRRIVNTNFTQFPETLTSHVAHVENRSAENAVHKNKSTITKLRQADEKDRGFTKLHERACDMCSWLTTRSKRAN